MGNSDNKIDLKQAIVQKLEANPSRMILRSFDYDKGIFTLFYSVFMNMYFEAEMDYSNYDEVCAEIAKFERLLPECFKKMDIWRFVTVSKFRMPDYAEDAQGFKGTKFVDESSHLKMNYTEGILSKVKAQPVSTFNEKDERIARFLDEMGFIYEYDMRPFPIPGSFDKEMLDTFIIKINENLLLKRYSNGETWLVKTDDGSELSGYSPREYKLPGVWWVATERSGEPGKLGSIGSTSFIMLLKLIAATSRFGGFYVGECHGFWDRIIKEFLPKGSHWNGDYNFDSCQVFIKGGLGMKLTMLAGGLTIPFIFYLIKYKDEIIQLAALMNKSTTIRIGCQSNLFSSEPSLQELNLVRDRILLSQSD